MKTTDYLSNRSHLPNHCPVPNSFLKVFTDPLRKSTHICILYTPLDQTIALLHTRQIITLRVMPAVFGWWLSRCHGSRLMYSEF